MKFWQIWSHEIEYETEKTWLISCSNKLPKRRKRESARRGVEEEDVTFKSCEKEMVKWRSFGGDRRWVATELLRRSEMGCYWITIGDGSEKRRSSDRILEVEIFLFNLDFGVKWVGHCVMFSFGFFKNSLVNNWSSKYGSVQNCYTSVQFNISSVQFNSLVQFLVFLLTPRCRTLIRVGHRTTFHQKCLCYIVQKFISWTHNPKLH